MLDIFGKISRVNNEQPVNQWESAAESASKLSRISTLIYEFQKSRRPDERPPSRISLGKTKDGYVIHERRTDNAEIVGEVYFDSIEQLIELMR